MVEKRNIRKCTGKEISDFLEQQGEKAFRTKQIWQWLWQRGVTRFEDMTNLSKNTRELLDKYFVIKTIALTHIQKSNDGTTKLGFTLDDGQLIESVLIPSRDKATACVSSQAGCKLKCSFCATGGLGFTRDLQPEEIFDQVVAVKKMAEERGLIFSNIVFMGMGEPLLNYDNVMEAIQKITSEEGLAMSPYRITLSTSGIPEGIKRLADDQVRFNLAISLHSAINSTRNQIMPINKAYPLPQLAEAIKYFVEKTGTRPTFEYLLLKGINDSLEAAKALASFCRQFPVKINIIEYNQVEGAKYQHSPAENRDSFIRFLESKNIVVNLRHSKGKDIDAACGQLANKNQ
ncbi:MULTISPECIES: 23S rRNA (adenine(2503)-C(2))-methyltransferase RlmN [Porphyromonadaceae]|uniref:Probable dual-specificity RNA methyltransferase RlmN n=1 Tax=Sanguibacteroides justesenii TaxID=1547597 RepID=A0A0C3N9X3_9PORP|nr:MULTISPECIES: 23S rRNA (adenine(2503)-C(2))-methyltransferase RlmN [Porphyromonadaceae]KIO42822.1 50S rRNA methyltransferase [Sanguibacteroides justesenii]KIO45058.1 50S rRNA methyltransferase [Sanguibacteroides justesenii]